MKTPTLFLLSVAVACTGYGTDSSWPVLIEFNSQTEGIQFGVPNGYLPAAYLFGVLPPPVSTPGMSVVVSKRTGLVCYAPRVDTADAPVRIKLRYYTTGPDVELKLAALLVPADGSLSDYTGDLRKVSQFGCLSPYRGWRELELQVEAGFDALIPVVQVVGSSNDSTTIYLRQIEVERLPEIGYTLGSNLAAALETPTSTPTMEPQATPTPTLVGGSGELRVRAFIDGTDLVMIRGDSLYYIHKMWEKPRGVTYVNGIKWQPEWMGYLSDTFSGIVPALPLEEGYLFELSHDGHDRVSFMQYPNARNDFITIVKLENIAGGAEWDEFTLRWRKAEGPTPTPVQTIIPTYMPEPPFAEEYPVVREPLKTIGMGTALAAAYTPDGSQVAIVGGCNIDFWDVATGTLVRSINHLHGRINAITFSPDGSRFVTGAENGSVVVWDTASGQFVREFYPTYNREVTYVGFLKNADTVVASGRIFAYMYEVWDVVSGERVGSGPFTNQYECVVSPDCTRGVYWDTFEAQPLMLWDIEYGCYVRPLNTKIEFVRAAAFNQDGSILAVMGDLPVINSFARELELIDVDTGETLHSMTENVSDTTDFLAFSSDGRSLIEGLSDGTVRIWDIESGTVTTTITGYESIPTNACFAPDGNTCLVLSGDRREGWPARIYSTSDGSLRRGFGAYTPAIVSAALSPDGNTAAIFYEDATLRLWDVQTERVRHSVMCGEPGYIHRVDPVSIAFSPDSRLVCLPNFVFSSKKPSGLIVKVEDGTVQQTIMGDILPRGPILFTPEGSHILFPRTRETFELIDVASGETIRTFPIENSLYWVATVSPDGLWLFIGELDSSFNERMVSRWNLQTGEKVTTYEGVTLRSYFNDIRFLPESNELLVVDDYGTVNAWDAATGERIIFSEWNANYRKTIGTGAISSVPSMKTTGENSLNCTYAATFRFTPDGANFIHGAGDISIGPLTLRDTRTGAIQKFFAYDLGHTTAVSFHPTRPWFLSGGQNGRAFLWDLNASPSPKTLSVPAAQTEVGKAVTHLAFSQDDSMGLIQTSDGKRSIWTFPNSLFAKTGGLDRMILTGYRGSTGFNAMDLQAWDWNRNERLKAEVASYAWQIGALQTVAWSPDGKAIAAGGANGLQVWMKGQVRNRMTRILSKSSIVRIEFSSDGSRLTAVTAAGDILIWETNRYELVQSLTKYGEPVQEAILACGNEFLFRRTTDGVKVYRANGSDPLLAIVPPSEESAPFTALAVSSDGTKVMTGCSDGSVYLWTIDASQLE